MKDYKELLKRDITFRYQLLGRLQSDCNYYLGFGGRSKNSLWAGDEERQIEIMKALWKSFPKDGKPEWLTWSQILDFERNMVLRS